MDVGNNPLQPRSVLMYVSGIGFLLSPISYRRYLDKVTILIVFRHESPPIMY
jgi:hypothetical protein